MIITHVCFILHYTSFSALLNVAKLVTLICCLFSFPLLIFHFTYIQSVHTSHMCSNYPHIDLPLTSHNYFMQLPLSSMYMSHISPTFHIPPTNTFCNFPYLPCKCPTYLPHSTDLPLTSHNYFMQLPLSSMYMSHIYPTFHIPPTYLPQLLHAASPISHVHVPHISHIPHVSNNSHISFTMPHSSNNY